MTTAPPAQTPVVIGHDSALKHVAKAYASGRMPHAWLITGIEGIGKATLAFHMAHYVLSGGENTLGKLNMQHPASRLVAAESHPDLFIVRRPTDEKTGIPKDIIPAEDARKIAPFLRMTASHGGWRMAIIDEAHALNRFGQNAILKVIEEPPSRCLIVLTATTVGALLPTIKSRCCLLPLKRLDTLALRTVLARSGLTLPEAGIERLIAVSGGSAGFALQIAETQALPLIEELLALLRGLPALDMTRVHALGDRIGRKGESASFSVLEQFLTDTLRQAARGKALGMSSEILPLSIPLDRSLRLWDNVRQIFAKGLEANLDHKLAFVNAMTEIRHTAA
jgi:DNA polymerase III subunit delta'